MDQVDMMKFRSAHIFSADQSAEAGANLTQAGAGADKSIDRRRSFCRPPWL